MEKLQICNQYGKENTKIIYVVIVTRVHQIVYF